MPAARRSLTLLLVLVVRLLLLPSAAAAVSPDHWAKCDTESQNFYTFVINDTGCQLQCIYLTSSFDSSSEDRHHKTYLDETAVHNHSLTWTPECQASMFPATGQLCVTIVAAKFYDGPGPPIIPSYITSVRFQVEVGEQTVTSEELQRSPVRPDGRVHYNFKHCFPQQVSLDNKIHVFAVWGVQRNSADLLDSRSVLTPRTVLSGDRNGTLFSSGDIEDTIVDLIITYGG